MKRIIFGILLIIILAACGSTEPAPTATRTSSSGSDSTITKTSITINCQDCKDAGMLVNLWDTPQSVASGAKLQAQVPHGTKCSVEQRGKSKDDGRIWLVVDCGDLNIGWILEDLTK